MEQKEDTLKREIKEFHAVLDKNHALLKEYLAHNDAGSAAIVRDTMNITNRSLKEASDELSRLRSTVGSVVHDGGMNLL